MNGLAGKNSKLDLDSNGAALADMTTTSTLLSRSCIFPSCVVSLFCFIAVFHICFWSRRALFCCSVSVHCSFIVYSVLFVCKFNVYHVGPSGCTACMCMRLCTRHHTTMFLGARGLVNIKSLVKIHEEGSPILRSGGTTQQSVVHMIRVLTT